MNARPPMARPLTPEERADLGAIEEPPEHAITCAEYAGDLPPGWLSAHEAMLRVHDLLWPPEGDASHAVIATVADVAERAGYGRDMARCLRCDPHAAGDRVAGDVRLTAAGAEMLNRFGRER